MLHRALSLLFLLCPLSLVPGDVVTFLANGIKNIVVPVVTAAATGRQISNAAKFARMHDFSEDRGVPKGAQSREVITSSDSPFYSDAGLPLYKDGIPTEEYYRDQMYKAQRQELEHQKLVKEREEAAKAQRERQAAEREKQQVAHLEKVMADKMKAYEEGRGFHPEMECMIRHSKQPKGLAEAAKKLEEQKGGGSSGGPKKDDDPLDKIKHRSDLQRKEVQDPDIRKSYKELGFPDTTTPGGLDRELHIFDDREGHILKRTKIAVDTMNRAFREGTHLGQDIHGNHHIEWIHPENGDQFWLKVRPDGKLMDGGASETGKHWIRDPKTNFLQKPKTAGKKGNGGGNWKYKVITVIAGSAIEGAANATKNRLGLNDDQLAQMLEGKIEKMMPQETQNKLAAERKAAFDRAADELRAYEEAKLQHYNEKKYPKSNLPVIVEKKIEHDLAPRPVQRAEYSSSSSSGSSSSSARSFSVSGSSSSSLRLSDSQMSEIRTSSGGSFKPSGGIGSMKLGTFSGSAPMLGSFGKFANDDDGDDMLWDNDDDDDDNCTGLGCL